jgi:hypothetical protein
MKCVCPMGGDRTCPDDCILAKWAGLSPSDRKAQRKPYTEQLYREGFTIEAIATQLGVNHATISRDLEEFVHDAQTPERTSKRGRKGEGRPKGSKRKPRVKQDIVQAAVYDLVNAGKPVNRMKLVNEFGVGEHAVQLAVARAEGRQEALNDPEIDRAALSLSAQQKLDAALRQQKRNQDLIFETRVRDEVKRRIDEIVLPHWKEKIAKAEQLYTHRRGAMSKETFNIIRRALHPDSRQAISDKKLAEAFDTFMGLEKFLLNEKDSPTELPDLPQTWADWEQAKQRAAAERRAKRQAGHTALRTR